MRTVCGETLAAGKRFGTVGLSLEHTRPVFDMVVSAGESTLTMRYRRFGRTGWQVSEIGMGTWVLGGNDWGPQDDRDSVATLHRALELGCNFIDTARAYGNGRSEQVIAKALGQWRGERPYVATKIRPVLPGAWPPSPYDAVEQRFPESQVREQLELSLRALETDCLDLVQIHTWSRAWNRDPLPFAVLRRAKEEGKIRAVGVSTPEHDQYAVLDLMRDGWVDSVQVIYNIFDQEAQSQLFPEALRCDIGIIVRVPYDESSLTGKLTPETTWPAGDMRGRYFAGDRLERTVRRVAAIREVLGAEEPDMAAAALKFCLKPPAVSTVIPGIRSPKQAEANCRVGSLPPMSDKLEMALHKHYWRRAFWHSGK
jgi:aryl-alcohol dehydrogenase-like predicted oxidoreductase